MENSEITNNENEPINEIPKENQNEIHEELNNNISNETNETESLDKTVETNTKNSETTIDNSQKPPIVEEKKEENPTIIPTNSSTSNENTTNTTNVIHDEPVSNLPETSTTTPEVATATPPKTPELTTRKSSKNLSKEEKLRRQRELRKKKILASSQERLSRITKTYSQGSSYYDSSDKDDSSLSRKSSSRSIHNHYTLERNLSSNSINKDNNINATINEQNNSQPINEQNSNLNNLSRNSSVNSINSLKNNIETITRDINDSENNNSGNLDSNQKNDETEISSINNSDITNHTNKPDSTANANDNNANDFARLLFREMLKEEFNKSNNSYGQNVGLNQPGNHDFKNGMDSFLKADKPFEALGKMFDFLNVDEKTTEEQRIADEKYKQYCKLSKLIHTAVIFLFSLLVVLVSIRAVHVIEDYGTTKRNFIGNFFFRLSNSDTLSLGKNIFGMTPWTCFVLLETTLLAGQIGYQYVFNIKKETWKEFDLIPIPVINKFISLVNQYKLYIEVFVNDLFLYLFIIGFSVSVGKIFY